MAAPKRCPHCDEEMDENLAEEGICPECGEEFDETDIKEDDDV